MGRGCVQGSAPRIWPARSFCARRVGGAVSEALLRQRGLMGLKKTLRVVGVILGVLAAAMAAGADFIYGM